MTRLVLIGIFICTAIFTSSGQATLWRYSFGSGILGSGRILGYKNTYLNAVEKNQLQTLEVIRPGYTGSIGVEKETTRDSRVGLNMGYQYGGFGSKIYVIPDTAQNNTPQYTRLRESYIIHRIFLGGSFGRTVFQRGNSGLFIYSGVALSYNSRFVRRRYSIRSDGSVGITATKERPLPEFPKIDFSIQTGVGYERKIGKKIILSVISNLRYFVRSYTTRGDNRINDYLFLKKKTTGHLYTFGLELRISKAIGQ